MRARSMSFYSMEDFQYQMKQQDELQTKIREEDELSSHSTLASAKSVKHLNYFSIESDEEEDYNEEQEISNVNEVNLIYESNYNILTSDLKESESKMVCKCIKHCIFSKQNIFANCNQINNIHRSLTMNSLTEMKIRKYIYLMLKQSQPKKYADKEEIIKSNFFYQNIEGDERLKILIASNSIEEKSKFISQLVYTDNDNRIMVSDNDLNEEEGGGGGMGNDDDDEDEDDGLGLGASPPKKNKTKSLLDIIETKMLYNNKIIDMTILDTDNDFLQQPISTIYYKLPRIIVGIIDNEKIKQSLVFIETLYQQYIKYSLPTSQKLIIIDINYPLGSKAIDQYCTKHGITYMLLDKDYINLPISLINYLLLFSNPKPKKDTQMEWEDELDGLKIGYNYNVEEAFFDSAGNKEIKRPKSLSNLKL